MPNACLANCCLGLSGLGCGEGVETGGGEGLGGWTAGDGMLGCGLENTKPLETGRACRAGCPSVLPVSCPSAGGCYPPCSRAGSHPPTAHGAPSSPSKPAPTSQDWPGPATSLGSPATSQVNRPVTRAAHPTLRPTSGKATPSSGRATAQRSTCLWPARARTQQWLLLLVSFWALKVFFLPF